MEIFRTSELPHSRRFFWGALFDLLPLDIVCKCLFNGTGKHKNRITHTFSNRSFSTHLPVLSSSLNDNYSHRTETEDEGEKSDQSKGTVRTLTGTPHLVPQPQHPGLKAKKTTCAINSKKLKVKELMQRSVPMIIQFKCDCL